MLTGNRMISIGLALFMITAVSCSRPATPTMPLHTAISKQNAAQVRVHINHGTNINGEFIPAGYPFAGTGTLHHAVLVNNREIARMLLDAGANVEMKSFDGSLSTPLIWAAYWGISDMVEFLVEYGADIAGTDAFGTTPLQAASIENVFVQGKDPTNIKEFNAQRADIRKYLKNKGAQVN